MRTKPDLTTLREIENNELAFIQDHRSAVWNAGGPRLFVSSDAEVKTWNHVAGFEEDGTREEEIVARCVAIFADWQRPPCLKITPMSRPAGLEPLLVRSGWTVAARLTHMVLDGTPPPAPEIRVRSCESDDEIRLFSEVQSCGFGDPGWAGWVSKINLANARRPNQRFYLAENGSAPAGVCLLLTTGRVAGLYAVATLSEQRGRGVATALVRHAVDDSKQMGADLVCLNTATGGPAEKVFGRLGFSPVFESRFYVKP